MTQINMFSPSMVLCWTWTLFRNYDHGNKPKHPSFEYIPKAFVSFRLNTVKNPSHTMHSAMAPGAIVIRNFVIAWIWSLFLLVYLCHSYVGTHTCENANHFFFPHSSLLFHLSWLFRWSHTCSHVCSRICPLIQALMCALIRVGLHLTYIPAHV